MAFKWISKKIGFVDWSDVLLLAISVLWQVLLSIIDNIFEWYFTLTILIEKGGGLRNFSHKKVKRKSSVPALKIQVSPACSGEHIDLITWEDLLW